MTLIKYILGLLIIVSALVSCTTGPVNSCEKLNTEWKFFPGDDSMAIQPDYDDSTWRILDIPHDWSIEGEFSEDHPTEPAGGALPAGIGWYRKHFHTGEIELNSRFFIDFDGVYRNSEVWINGHYLGKRANGYISFSYEITPYILSSEQENILSVRVDNSLQANSRWYTGSGIYRNVRLRKEANIHIVKWGTFITTPVVTADEAIINISMQLCDIDSTEDKVSINTSIYSESGMLVSKNTAQKNSSKLYNSSHSLAKPLLWSVDEPIQYRLKTELFINGKKQEVKETLFGIRHFHFDPDSGFYLNDKQLEIRGVNLHHDLGALGAAINMRAIERQLEIMKGMGVNAIRTAHNPPAPELLDLCDQMGFLVMDEAFDVWRKKKVKYDYHMDWEENHEKDLRDLILRDRNHPSVFMWSIGNEIREQFDSTGIEITRELVQIVKELDSSRPVTCALTETDPEKNFIYMSGKLDILGFNYKHKDWSNFKENFPGQKMIAAENMSAYATRGHYDMPSDSTRYWPEKHGVNIIGANEDYTVSAFDMVCAYWGATHEETLKAFYSHDFIGGLFIWSGFDFLGEPVPYNWPAKNSYYGVVDLAGFPKDVYYLYQSIWTDTPTLHLFPHWNWEDGQLIDVWAYYNQADEVELFLNNKSLGTRKKGDDDFHVRWRVEYEPGNLKAISKKDGATVLIKEISTSASPHNIELNADRKTINADGRDLSYIKVSILDENLNLVPDAASNITFDISGPGKIVGVDNGYQASHEPFKASERKAFNGMCLVIVQASDIPGEINLTARSESLKSQTILITTR